MTAYVTTADGRQLQLPVPLAWEMDYTAGVPCDSFWLRCPWEPGQEAHPENWVRFTALEQGETVFTGVVDECEVTWSGQGSCLELSGRGMAALLLDNEAEGQDYLTATLEDILRDHVTPFGIRVAERTALPAVSQFSVSTGSSEWSVLYEFARYYGGVTPRFDRKGRLVLAGWTEQETLAITDSTPVTALTLRERRYGVLSEIWVRDKTRQAVEKVVNTAFRNSGGCCRQVITMPGKSNYKAMRYSGQFQLDKSEAERKRLEVTIPILFYGKPGDLVGLQRSDWDGNGSYRAVEVQVAADETGGRTVLTLAEPDVVL
jgi:hypothetical protein